MPFAEAAGLNGRNERIGGVGMDGRDRDDNILDIIRIIATVQVFAGHVIMHFTPPVPEGHVDAVYFIRGVPILFVLCGFLSARSMEGRPAKSWLIGRLARVLPGFWVCILVNTAIIAVLYPVRPSWKELAVYLVTQFSGLNFYTGSWLRGYGVGAPNGVLWTIPVQLQFFFLAPLIHRFMHGKSMRSWVMCISGLTFFSWSCDLLDGKIPEVLWKLLGVTVAPYLYFLVFGMMLWYHRDTVIPKAERFRWLLLVGYVCWKLCENTFRFPHALDGVLYNTVTTLLLALLIAAFGFCGKVRFKRDRTYGFYLYHMVFMNIIVHLEQNSFLPLPLGALRVFGIAFMSFIAAWASDRFVETPSARLISAKLGKRICPDGKPEESH